MMAAQERLAAAWRRLFLAVNPCETCRREVEAARHSRWCVFRLCFQIANRLDLIFGPGPYDSWTDVWTLHGARFSGELIRELSKPSDLPGPWFRLLSKEGSTITAESPGDLGEASVACVECGTAVRLLTARGVVIHPGPFWCPRCAAASTVGTVVK